jgi:perosamine synthetase
MSGMNPNKYLGNELKYLERVLNSESWSATGGNWNNALETEFAKRLGVKYAIAMNSGTSTLHAALVAAGVGVGDEVISPALTVIMDATATLHAGATPVFADVSLATYTINPADIERKITEKTKAIITVSLYGLPPDLDPIMKIANKYNLVVIEDNAQCLLSTYRGKMTGTIGHMASYSFENTKHISCGEGGMIVTDNEEYAERLRKIGGHGFKNLKAEEGRIRLNQDVFQSPYYKRHDTLGWNYRMPEFNAAIALAQLERIEDLVSMRVLSANYFMKVMQTCDYLSPQFVPQGYTNSYYTLGAVYEGDKKGISWEEFRDAYIANGGDGIYGAWSVPYQELVMIDLGITGSCPTAEWLQPRLMQFKTNYRDKRLAETKAYALWKTIREFE